MYCHDCAYYTELGECRHPKVSRRDHAYFEKACGNFEQKSENTQPETTQEMKEETKPTTAVCQECGRELPLEEFATNRWGRTKYCKECFKKKQQAGSAKPAGIKSGTKKETKPEQVGTKSPAEKLEEMYLAEKRQDDLKPASAPAPAAPSRRKEFAHVATEAVQLKSDEIIEIMACLALELRERGYEVTGTIRTTIDI